MKTNIMVISAYDDFNPAEREELERQDICLDDFDYMLFVPEPEKILRLMGAESTELEVPWGGTYHFLIQMLHGPNRNEWHCVTLWGQKWALGVAYHA